MLKHLCTRLVAGLVALLALPAALAGPVTQVQDLGPLTAAGTFAYGNSFNDGDPANPGVQIAPGGLAITLGTGTDFHDHYAFSTTATTASFTTLTIDLGNIFNIEGLQVKLYGAPLAVPGTVGAESLLGALVPVATSVAEVGSIGEQQTISARALPAGSYVLDVSGFVVGVSGGSYAGVMNFSQVPEPAGLALSATALSFAAAAAMAARQRRRALAARLRSHACVQD